LHLWECIVMTCFYIFYVVVVVVWHWMATRRQRRRAKDAAARTHIYGAVGSEADILEPYRDEEEEQNETAPMGHRRNTIATDISALERGPRIEIDRVMDDTMDQEELEDERGRHLTAEMTSSMRVNRPRGRRSTTTITPIRPSLVGALEFRSVLASLQKSGNVPLDTIRGRGYSEQRVSLAAEQSNLSLADVDDERRPSLPSGASSGRSRALSQGAIPRDLDDALPPRTTTPPPAQRPTQDLLVSQEQPPESVSQATTSFQPEGSSSQTPQVAAHGKSPSLHLQIPSPQKHSPHSSPSLSPFPGLS